MLVFRARPRRDPVVEPTLTNSERRIMRILGSAMSEVREQVTRDEGKILDAIQHSSADKVANLVTVEPWLEAQEKIQDELFAELRSAGQRVKLPTMQKATISFRFDATRPEAARWAANSAGSLIVGVVQGQVDVVRNYVSRAESGEFTPQQVARGLRDTVGLTNEQAGWVNNFRERRILESINSGRSFEQAFADSERATQRYHDRIHRYRTETIARTEILRASNEGRREAWAQGVQEGFIDPTWVKRWSTEFDARTCDRCGPLNGETVPVMKSFPWGDPPLHPNCRCTLLLDEPQPTDEFSGLTDDQLESTIYDLIDGQASSADMSIDQRIAKIEAEREPIRQRLVQADFGEIQLSPEEYQSLVDQHKPIFEELMALKKQKLEATQAPTVQPTQAGISTYERISEGLDYTEDQLDAFQQWQGDGYRRVQGSLYGKTNVRGVDPELRRVIDGLDDSMTTIPRDTVLYRGQTQGLDNLQIGSTVKTGSYTSTTTDPVTAGAFSKSAGQVLGQLKETDTPTIMRITPTRSKGAIVPNSNEFEIVLQRNAEMRVVGITEEVINGVKFRILDMEA